MPLIPLKFRPGLFRDWTNYSSQGGWFDCQWVRFRLGLPEKMGGWGQRITTAFLGVCRELNAWALLTGAQKLCVGTNLKFYVSDLSTYTDVTPLRLTVNPMANNPFAVVNGVTTMTVTDIANGAVINDFVTFSGATGFAGLAAGDLNQEFQITSIIDAAHYTVTLLVTPSATTAGGGAAIVAKYQINTGSATAQVGLGWGTGTWGRGTWGSNATNGVVLNLRLWNTDTFGQDLIANVRNGGIYHWDATNPNDRMVALADLPGQSDAPVIASTILVSPEEQHTVAFGTNPIGSAAQDPLFVRWATAESYLDWTPAITNSAGGYRLSVGTQIEGVLHTRGQTVIWTDIALYTMTWTGPPYTFNFQLVGSLISILAPDTIIDANDVVYWMGDNQFWMYDGRIQLIECPIADYIFSRMNFSQSEKIQAFTNMMFYEVGWLYPSGDECDSYVIYNYHDRIWYFGSVDRTAWLDLGGIYDPLATSAESILYDQEFGFDDGSTNPPTAITAFIESSPLETQEEGSGEHFLFMKRLIPDVTFRNSTAATPSVTMTLETRDFPGGSVSQTQGSSVVQTATVPVDRFTDQCFIRLRGRSAIFRCESSDLGVTWRLGTPRVEYVIDGRR